MRFVLSSSSVVQDFRRRARRDNASALEDMAVVRNIFDQIEIVSGSDHRLSSAAATHQKVDHLALALGIKRGGGFVQQQDFGIENQHRRQRDPLFFSRREVMRRAVLQVRDLHLLEHLGDAKTNLFLRPLQLQRPESDFVKHGRIE